MGDAAGQPAHRLHPLGATQPLLGALQVGQVLHGHDLGRRRTVGIQRGHAHQHRHRGPIATEVLGLVAEPLDRVVPALQLARALRGDQLGEGAPGQERGVGIAVQTRERPVDALQPLIDPIHDRRSPPREIEDPDPLGDREAHGRALVDRRAEILLQRRGIKCQREAAGQNFHGAQVGGLEGLDPLGAGDGERAHRLPARSECHHDERSDIERLHEGEQPLVASGDEAGGGAAQGGEPAGVAALADAGDGGSSDSVEVGYDFPAKPSFHAGTGMLGHRL